MESICFVPSVDEGIKKLWHIYTMDYYLAINKEENVTFCDSTDGPGVTTLSEISPSGKGNTV